MSDKFESWDDVIEQAEKDTFVGREHELALFSQEIARRPPGKLIFYISGPGGVGKTKLLERFQETATKHQFLVLESDDQQKDIPTLLGHFAHQLERAGQKMDPFSERFKLYRQLRQEIENDVDAPQGLAGALARTSVNLVWGLLDELPVARQVTKLAPDAMREGAATQAGEWADYLSRKLKNKDEVALMRDPVPELAPLFFKAVNKVAQKQSLLLCFDNYEFSRSYLDEWLTRLRDYDPSPNMRLAMAGRDVPGPLWDGFKNVLSHITLNVFTPAEAEAFLDLRGIQELERRQEILEFSDRLPVLMDWLAVPSGDGPDPEIPTTDIVERFLRWEHDPNLRQAVLYLAIPYTFNQDLVALLLGKEEPTEVETEFNWLCGLPGIRSRENGWQYHEVVRRRLLYYLRQKSPRTYADLHGRLVTHYRARRENLALTPEKAWRNERWQAYTIEYLYHRLVAAPDSHWVEVLDLFTLALLHRRKLARGVMERLNLPASRDELSTEQRETVALFLMQLDAVQAGDLSDGAVMFDRLCQEATLSASAQAIVFDYRGRARLQMGNYEAALADLNRAIELDEKSASAIASRGATYLQMGNYEAALADLNRAIELDEKSVSATTMRGIIYLLMGNYEAALANFNRTIELDEKDASAITMRGIIYLLMGNFEAALANLNRAIELDEKSASAIANRGNTYLQMGNYEAALADIDRAIDLEPEQVAFRGIRSAILLKSGKQMEYLEAAAGLSQDIPELVKMMSQIPVDKLLQGMERFVGSIGSDPSPLTSMLEAFKMSPEQMAKEMERVTIMASAGIQLLMGNYEVALADLNRAIELDEKDASAIAKRGTIYLLMGNYEVALANFNRAIELDEKNASAIAMRGNTYLVTGNYEAALADIDRAIDLEPEQVAFRGIRSAILLKSGKQMEYLEAAAGLSQDIPELVKMMSQIPVDKLLQGMERFAGSIGSDPSRLTSVLEVFKAGPEQMAKEMEQGTIMASAGIQLQMGNYEAALTDLNRAIELDEKSVSAIASRGVTYRLMGNYQAALTDLNHAIELDEKDASAIASRGVTYRLMGNYEVALANLNRAIELDEKDASAIASRGATYRLMGNYEAALADFNRAIELDEKDASAITKRGETYLQMGNYEAALADLNRAIELDEKSASAMAMRGNTYLLMGNYEAALANFNRTIELDEKDASAITMRGIIYLLMGNFEAALANLNRAIELDEKSASAIANRGNTYLQMGNYEAALADIDRAIDLEPEQVAFRGIRSAILLKSGKQMEYLEAAAGLSQDIPELVKMMSQIPVDKLLQGMERFVGSIGSDPSPLTSMLEAFKVSPEQMAKEMERVTIMASAGIQLQMGNYEAALADLNRAIELDEKSVSAIAKRGNTYRQMGNYEAALADFNRAIELDEKNASAIAMRGIIYLVIGNYEAALADFNRAIELDEKSVSAIASRGVTYRQMGNYEAALADFNRAIELDEKSASAIASRGETYLQMSNYEAALTDLNRAIELDEKSASAIASRGVTYRQMGNYEAALADFNRAIKLDEKSASAIAKRGVTYRLMGNYEAALDDFNRAIELDEKSASAIASRGVTYRLMGNYEAALDDLNHAIELDEKSAWAIASRGETYQQMGNYEVALADLGRAIELAETPADWWHYKRALTYLVQAEFQAAEDDLRQAIALAEPDYQSKPQDWNNTFNLALYYLTAGQTAAAEGLYGKAENAPAHVVRDAILDLKDLLRVLPEHQQAAVIRDRLLSFVE